MSLLAVTTTAFDPGLMIAILTGLGLLGGVGLGAKAILERRNLKANAQAASSKAGSDDATAASIVAAAARELIDPLRRELAAERESHADELEEERRKVEYVRGELNAATRDVEALRAALRRALKELESSRERVAAQEREIIRLREFAVLNGLTPPA